MIYKVAVLVAMLVGPFDPPVLTSMNSDKNYISASACEEFRASKEFTESTAALRDDLLKKFANTSISIASKCISESTKPALKGDKIGRAHV